MEETGIEQAQKNARLMGILYGVVVGLEATKQPVTYDAIATVMQQYCSQQELENVFDAVRHFANAIARI